MRHWKFNEFELDGRAFRLLRSGTEIEIGKRSFDLLEYLIEHRDRVVSTKELLSEVWRAKALSPSAIPTCMLDLRKLLGDDAQPSRIIRTVRSRGYQFVAEATSRDSLEGFTGLTDGDPPFAGRNSEIAALTSTLNIVASKGACRTILIRGSAGIGKTRLLQEFLRQSPDEFPTFVVRCPELDGAPPYWPWRRLLTKIERSTSDLPVSVAPGVEGKSSPTKDHPKMGHPLWEGFTDRFSIFNTWSQIAHSLCRDGPAVLVFEDLHRTDIDSIDLLRWIADDLQNHPLMIIGSTRCGISDTSISSGIATLAATVSSAVVELTPLCEASIVEMVRSRTSHPEELAAALHERTAGNPFFIQRILQMTSPSDDYADIESAVTALPISSEEILTHQLEDLSRKTLRSLEVASVFGKTFAISSATSVVGVSADEFLTDIEPARIAGIVSELRDESDQMQFTHMILRDALYESLSATDRKKLHLDIAHSLIESEALTFQDTAGVIAEHLEQALPVSDTASVSEYASIAGKACLDRFAFREARSHFLKVRKLMDRDPRTTQTARCIARFRLAEAELYSDDRDAAREALFEASQIARSASLPCLLAECGIRISPDFLAIEVGAHDPELVHLLFEALETLPEEEHSLRSQVMARLSLALSWAGSSERSAQFALEALSLARKTNDSVALSASLAARADALHGPDRVNERLEVVSELKHVVRRNQDRPGIIMQQIRHIAALLDSGDIQSVDVEIGACEASVREMNAPQYLWYPIAFRAMRSIMRGDFKSADELGNEFLAIGTRTHDRNVASSRACQVCAQEIERDRGKAALPLAVEFVKRHPDVRAWSAGVGFLHLIAEQPRDAFDILDTFDFNSIRCLFRETGGSAGVVFLAEIAIRANDTARIAQIYDLCSAVGERSATLGFAMGYFGCFSRYAGLLASALGLVSESLEHLHAAVATERHHGSTLWRVHSELDLAQVLFRNFGRTSEVDSLIESAKLVLRSTDLPRAKRRYRDIASEIY